MVEARGAQTSYRDPEIAPSAKSPEDVRKPCLLGCANQDDGVEMARCEAHARPLCDAPGGTSFVRAADDALPPRPRRSSSGHGLQSANISLKRHISSGLALRSLQVVIPRTYNSIPPGLSRCRCGRIDGYTPFSRDARDRYSPRARSSWSIGSGTLGTYLTYSIQRTKTRQRLT